MRTILALALSLLLGSAALAADYALSEDETVVFVTGTIEPGDDVKFIDAIKDKPVTTVALNSGGGHFITSSNIGFYVYDHKLTTYVNEGECVSACAFIWLAGARRLATELTTPMIHAPYAQDENGVIDDSPETLALSSRLVGWYFGAVGIRNFDFSTAVSFVPPFLLLSLTPSFMEEYGLTMEVTDLNFIKPKEE